MNAEQKIKLQILMDMLRDNPNEKLLKAMLDTKDVTVLYDTDDVDFIDIRDPYEEAFRCGGIDTNIPPDTNRYYYSKSKATQLYDGSWVGWTYYYGGCDEDESAYLEWMEDTYYLNCVESTQIVTVQTFTKVGIVEESIDAQNNQPSQTIDPNNCEIVLKYGLMPNLITKDELANWHSEGKGISFDEYIQFMMDDGSLQDIIDYYDKDVVLVGLLKKPNM